MKLFNWRNLRVLVLLCILALVAIYSKGQMLDSRDWLGGMPVVIYPIVGNDAPQVQAYIDQLSTVHFIPVERFIASEAKRYKLRARKPVRIILGKQIETPPPATPHNPSIPSAIWWALKVRWWAWQNTPEGPSETHVRMYTIYHPATPGAAAPHSAGLAKGLIGIANVFASNAQRAQNHVVIAHELLHTVGAQDHYAAAGEPIYPEGYAEPQKRPRLPQRYCEIMAIRIAQARGPARMPSGLKQCRVGGSTATAIGWLGKR